jgi:uncharacterized delta-60 repeat protein
MKLVVALALVSGSLLVIGSPSVALAGHRSAGFEVATDLGGMDIASAVTFLANGQIVAGGTTSGSSALVLYRHDGSLDPSFGADGVVVTDLSPGNVERVNDIGVQGRDRVVVVGDACSLDSVCGLVIARFRRDGSPDVQFGRGGRRYYGHSSGEALAIQTDGRLLTAGSGSNDVGSDFSLVRFRADGSPDRSFGVDGLVLTDFGGTDVAMDVKIQSDGRILVAGSTDAGGESVFALARYLPDGRLDPSFGDGGTVTTDVGYCCAGAVGLVIQPDGRLVAAGNAEDTDSGLWVLVGYQPDGTLDPTFGVDGLVISNHGGFGTGLTDAAGRGEGQIVVSGWDGDEGPWAYFIVTWYDAHGIELDDEYGGFGGEAASYGEGIATYPNGHAAAVGFTADIYGTSNDFAVADYPGP